MKLYHGWLQIVRTPEIRQSNRTLDYGKGFCTHHGHYSNSPSSRQKNKVMNLNITQANLHLLLPAKASGVGRIYAEEHQCSILEGMRLFYASDLYRSLEREETKLWHLGAVALYSMWISA